MLRKGLNKKELQALRFIRNRLVHEGNSPSVRDLMKELGYGSPRSALLIINQLRAKGILKRRADMSLQLLKDLPTTQSNARTIDIPLVGNVACGVPIFAEENLEAMVPVSQSYISPNSRYFLLRAIGDSMDAVGIHDGDLVLVRQQSTATNGDKVVALINDDATIKEYHHVGNAVILQPRSKNKNHQKIILTEDFQIQGVVVATLPEIK